MTDTCCRARRPYRSAYLPVRRPASRDPDPRGQLPGTHREETRKVQRLRDVRHCAARVENRYSARAPSAVRREFHASRAEIACEEIQSVRQISQRYLLALFTVRRRAGLLESYRHRVPDTERIFPHESGARPAVTRRPMRVRPYTAGSKDSIVHAFPDPAQDCGSMPARRKYSRSREDIIRRYR